MSTPTVDDAVRLLADPMAYTGERRLHAALTHLRANAPVSWVDVAGYAPFRAITKHADVTEIERANTLFTNSPRPVLGTAEGDAMQTAAGVNSLIHMDGAQHRKVGAALARMEIHSFFTELLPRLNSAELTGEPQLLATTFVGGLKHLPIRYTLS